MSTQISKIKSSTEPVITWNALPDDVLLVGEPVENTGQPLLAGALRESLEIAGFIQPQMLIASNFGLCATFNHRLVVKAPDWLYIPSVKKIINIRMSYTPHLEGDIPAVVMEFLSHIEGGEYSVKPSYPPGKLFFYEQVLKVPVYVIFEPDGGLLEFYQLENGYYKLQKSDENERYWIDAMGLFLGTWRGEKAGRNGYWLRWWDKDGNLLPWSVEKIEQERQEKEKLRAYLKSQGIDPDTLPI